MTTVKDIRKKKQELKNKLEQLKSDYSKNSNLTESKYREHTQLKRDADNVMREMQQAEKMGYDIPPEMVKKRKDLLKQADIKLSESQQAQENMGELNKAANEAELSLKTWYVPVTKKDVYAAQKEIKAINIKIEKAEKVLSKEQQKDFTKHGAALMELESQHNKLMANIALGEDKQAEADELEAKINKLTKLSEQEKRNRYKQNGIIQQITNTLDELKSIKQNLSEDYKEIKRNFGITQAETKAKEYILTFEKLAKLKSELDFYCNKVDIKTNNQELSFPEFNLPAFSEINFKRLAQQEPSIDSEIETIILS